MHSDFTHLGCVTLHADMEGMNVQRPTESAVFVEFKPSVLRCVTAGRLQGPQQLPSRVQGARLRRSPGPCSKWPKGPMAARASMAMRRPRRAGPQLRTSAGCRKILFKLSQQLQLADA